MISGLSESTLTLSRSSKGLTAFIPPQFVNYNTVICNIKWWVKQTNAIMGPVRAIFCQGGRRGSEPLAQKNFARCRNFYETVEEEQGSYDKLT